MRKFVAEETKKIKQKSLWRSPAILENARSNHVVLDGKKFLNFSSNDYLGYAQHPEVIRSAQKALEHYGAGGRSSRLISGTLDLHRELEEKLAAFKGAESALVFPTGFMANLGVLASLLNEGDAVIMDRLNHASLIDAAKLSRSRLFVFDHASAESLEKVLKRTKSYRKRLVVTDSLFSMDGDFAPLKEIVALCGKHKVWLMIDDAHATGIFGGRGIGMAEHFGELGKIEIVMGTLSKALGSQGGFVCGSKEMIDFLKNRARTFIYTTALSPSSCAAALTALELIEKEPGKRKKLLSASQKLREAIQKKFPLNSKYIGDSGSQIVPFWVGPVEPAMAMSEHLKAAGIFAPAIRPPTVPQNECRIRFSLTSDHSESDIERLIQAL